MVVGKREPAPGLVPRTVRWGVDVGGVWNNEGVVVVVAVVVPGHYE